MPTVTCDRVICLQLDQPLPQRILSRTCVRCDPGTVDDLAAHDMNARHVRVHATLAAPCWPVTSIMDEPSRGERMALCAFTLLMPSVLVCRTGLGMNGDELKRNPVLTDFDVHDLNVDPKLPYEDNTFDVRAPRCLSMSL